MARLSWALLLPNPPLSGSSLLGLLTPRGGFPFEMNWIRFGLVYFVI